MDIKKERMLLNFKGFDYHCSKTDDGYVVWIVRLETHVAVTGFYYADEAEMAYVQALRAFDFNKRLGIIK